MDVISSISTEKKMRYYHEVPAVNGIMLKFVVVAKTQKLQ